MRSRELQYDEKMCTGMTVKVGPKHALTEYERVEEAIA